jgi:hypothetical protein
MILKGYCETQKKEYFIDVKVVGTNALEDINGDNVAFGQAQCDYTHNGGICNCECSIIKQHKKGRGIKPLPPYFPISCRL